MIISHVIEHEPVDERSETLWEQQHVAMNFKLGHQRVYPELE